MGRAKDTAVSLTLPDEAREACFAVVSPLVQEAHEGIEDGTFTKPSDFLNKYEEKKMQVGNYGELIHPGAFVNIFREAQKLCPKVVRPIQLNDRVSFDGKQYGGLPPGWKSVVDPKTGNIVAYGNSRDPINEGFKEIEWPTRQNERPEYRVCNGTVISAIGVNTCIVDTGYPTSKKVRVRRKDLTLQRRRRLSDKSDNMRWLLNEIHAVQ